MVTPLGHGSRMIHTVLNTRIPQNGYMGGYIAYEQNTVWCCIYMSFGIMNGIVACLDMGLDTYPL